jgi:hypothetical protein
MLFVSSAQTVINTSEWLRGDRQRSIARKNK